MLFCIRQHTFEILYFKKGTMHRVQTAMNSLIPKFYPLGDNFHLSSHLFTVLPFMPGIDFFH